MGAILRARDKDGNVYDIPAIRGAQGPQGPQGETGPAGYTPVRGTDYWTAADQQAIVDAVLAALPAAEGVSV